MSTRKRKHPRRGRKKKRVLHVVSDALPMPTGFAHLIPLESPQPNVTKLAAALIHANRLTRHG
jgi:hypothetical protein